MESFGKIEEVNMVGYFQLLLLFAVKNFLQLKLGKASSLIFILNCKLQSSSCLTDGRVENKSSDLISVDGMNLRIKSRNNFQFRFLDS